MFDATGCFLSLISVNEGLFGSVHGCSCHNSSVWHWCASMGCTVVKRYRVWQGKHINRRHVMKESPNHNLQLAHVVELLYVVTILAAKMTILLQLNHIFVTSRKSIRFYLVQLLIWSNILWYIIAFFLLAFQCSPIARIWNPLIPGHCIVDFYPLTFVNAILNVVSDIAMLIMPILWAWKLQMGWRRKLGVSLIFASGVL